MLRRLREAAGRWAGNRLPWLLGILRRHRPILVFRKLGVVTLDRDVRAVLDDHEAFTVELYAPKMEAITGPFILGLGDTPLYRHDEAALRAAVRPADLDGIARTVLEAAREAVGRGGTVDVVADVVDPALERAIASYFGTPGPDGPTQARWARSLFHDIFLNPRNAPAVHERALADAARMRPHLDRLVAERKAQLAEGAAVPDDVLTRLLQAQDGAGGLHDVAIRHNFIGLITGWIPTVSKSFALALDELLGRPRELEGAKEAAREGNTELVGAYVFEAMRFQPQALGVLRKCAVERTVGAGTRHAKTIRPGTTLLVSTQSAMFDPAAVEEPGRFRTDRPWGDYLHFGHGLHTCFGEAINRVQLPALGMALLERPGLRRAGRLESEGPFPSSLRVAV
ncbi:MAG: cytochrome P450 [Actinomycetota bacterium]|nr:cytochrome P450 [Actinomycetota bacterium]